MSFLDLIWICIFAACIVLWLNEPERREKLSPEERRREDELDRNEPPFP